MMFNCLALLLIVLITLYLATQGLLSALLALVSAIFSSILAMALMEPLQSVIGGWRPDYARGVTFLLLFFLIFSATRIAADMIVSKNIQLPYLVNRLAGGVVGFFVAMVVIGSIILGIEMLPLHTSLMGYDRFADESRMQGDTPGVAAHGSSTWLAPERLTLAIWNGASGRGLGGNQAFEDVHPDLDVESYGYRNTVTFASNHTLPDDLMDVKTSWMTGDEKSLAPFGIHLDAGEKIVMVRTVVTRGKEGHDSTDPGDTNFRISPTEVRLVTNKAHQYYPVGYLSFGQTLQPLPLDAGALVEDYIGGKVTEDWVFQIGDDEAPVFIEMKALAHKSLAGLLVEKPVPALAAREYPQKPYQKESSTLAVTFDPHGGQILDAQVYVLRPTAQFKDVQSQVSTAYRHIITVLDAIAEYSTVWPKEGKAGVPGQGEFMGARQTGITIMNMPPTESVSLESALMILMLGPIESDGTQNASLSAQYVKDTLVPMFKNVSTGSALVISGAADPSTGKVSLHNIPKGNLLIFATMHTDKGFYHWRLPTAFTARSEKTLELTTTNAASPRIEMP